MDPIRYSKPAQDLEEIKNRFEGNPEGRKKATQEYVDAWKKRVLRD